MSKQDFETLQEPILALRPEEVKIPNMPVHASVQEAEDLFEWVQEDQEKLEPAGLDWQLVTDLPIRAGALRYSEAIWNRDSLTQEEAQKEWKVKSPEAFDLRDVLVHDFTHAFRRRSDLTNKVRAIREGGTNSDMLQDLNNLYQLGMDNKPLLDAIGFDWAKLEQARTWSDELASILAKANGERFDMEDTKVIRDKAYTYLKEAVDEIRLHGKYVFWRDDNRRQGYISKYHNR
ncbi:hypothetical protein [Marinilabilia sp.]